MVFEKGTWDEKMAEIVVNEVPFWIQIHGLELQLLTRYVGEVLDSMIGKVKEVDGTDNLTAWGKCLRARVLIDVAKPLIRGSKVVFSGSSYVVVLRYERLSEFCYVCGKLNHLEKDCPTIFAEEEVSVREKRKYEAWLKADGVKGITIEDISKSFNNKGKQKEVCFDMGDMGQMKEDEREHLAIQLVNMEPNSSMAIQDVHTPLEPLGNRMGRGRNSGGIECIVQGVSTGMGRLFGTPEFNTATFGNPVGITAGMQLEPYSNFNTGLDWANIQMWGAASVPMDTGINAIGGGWISAMQPYAEFCDESGSRE